MEQLLKVNQALCSKCGICAEVCPSKIIIMDREGPKIKFSPACIACGHCVASCPNAALDHVKAPLASQEPLPNFPVLDAKTAAAFLRSRRSTRCYKKDEVPREVILQLLEIARFAPTGGNSQGLSYIVINNIDILKEVITSTMEWMTKLVQTNPEYKGYSYMVNVYQKTGEDMVLRGAPCLIVATAPRDFKIGHDNARFSLEYIDLYATSLGLGTCWGGYVETCAGDNYSPLLEAMEIPKGTAVVGAMMVGYPKYTYQRLVNRNPLKVTWL